jgi:sortase A
VIGELLITLGLLLGLYVVWEVFWTNVEASAVAEEVLKTATETPDWIEPAVEQGPAPHYSYRTDPPPVDENPLSTPAIGGVWASLHVPRWGLAYNVPIVEGTDKKTILDRGMIGHYPNTAGPGQIGNFATAAHRITYGEPYAKIETLQNGDSLIVETARYYFVYKVYASQIVLPDAIGVTWPVPNDAGAVPTRRIITLTTCHPRWASTHRYVVWGELEYWADKAEGYLEELEG